MSNQKVIPLFLIITFFCTLAVTPESRIESSPECLTGLNRIETDETPRFQEVEQEKEVAKPAKKFPWLTVIGITVGVAIGTLLIFVVFKKKDYDIRGTWEMNVYPVEKPPYTLRIYFKGSKTEGEYSGDSYGAYAVEGKTVSLSYFTHGGGWSYSGAFDALDRMSGTFTISMIWTVPVTGTWWARKISSTAE